MDGPHRELVLSMSLAVIIVNIIKHDEAEHTISNAKTKSLKISDYFSKKKIGKPSLSGEFC